MPKKISNTKNVDNFEKRERLRWLIIICSIITIILAILSLTIHLGIGYALVFFFITYILKRMRSNTEIEASELVKKRNEEKKEKKKKSQ